MNEDVKIEFAVRSLIASLTEALEARVQEKLSGQSVVKDDVQIDKEFLTVAETAKVLNRCVRTIRKRIAEGQIKTQAEGPRGNLIARTEIAIYLRNQNAWRELRKKSL